jgi:hypothetical protein
MKLLGIVGSPHKIKGNTGRLMLEVLRAAEKEGATYETVVPPDIEQSKAQFMERMCQLMLYRKNEWSFEYEYWQKNREL